LARIVAAVPSGLNHQKKRFFGKYAKSSSPGGGCLRHLFTGPLSGPIAPMLIVAAPSSTDTEQGDGEGLPESDDRVWSVAFRPDRWRPPQIDRYAFYLLEVLPSNQRLSIHSGFAREGEQRPVASSMRTEPERPPRNEVSQCRIKLTERKDEHFQ
jgi:hypothetical protein